MKKFTLLFFFASSLFVNLNAQQDSLALVALYNATDGDNWINNDNWLTGPLDTWFGIARILGDYRFINLSNNNLCGTIPPELSNFFHPSYDMGKGVLNLSNNNLIGSIPPEIFSFGAWDRFNFNLSFNQLTGPIPPEIENLGGPELKIFLNDNQLNGSIPPEIGNIICDQLTIDLSNNNLSNHIPPEIGNISSFAKLQINLSNNLLTGTIPPEIGDLFTFGRIKLNFSKNKLTGSIPSEFGDLRSEDGLELDLSFNQLSGSIPSEIGEIKINPTGSFSLNLSYNKLSGSLPFELCNLFAITENVFLDFSNNGIIDLPVFPCSKMDANLIYNNLTFEDLEANISVEGINYNPQDSIGVSSDTAICEGLDIEISVLVGGEHNLYQWKKDNEIISGANSDSYIITNASDSDIGSYTCEINNTTVTDLTLYSRPFNISILSLPEVQANASKDDLCYGEEVILMGSGAESYSWNHGVINGQSFLPFSTEIYTVNGTDANGCVNTDQIEITVYQLPNVEANTTVSEVCLGESLTLTGSGAETYSWDNNVIDGQAFIPTSTMTYNVTGTDINGCQSSDQIEVIVDPLPNVDANTTETEICKGDEIILSGSGAVSYTWNQGVSDGVAFAPTETASYTVTGTDINGCQNTDQIEIIVHELPIVIANTTETTICFGDAITLTGSGAETYSWDQGVTDGISFSPITTSTYNVTGTDENGCSNSEQIQVVVNPLPNVTAYATADVVCQGEQVILSGSGAYSYEWNNDVTNGVAFVPLSTSIYTVTGTDVNGCQNTDNLEITVNPVYNFIESHSICEGEVYQWQGQNLISSGTIAVFYSTVFGCDSSYELTLTVNPTPEQFEITGPVNVGQSEIKVYSAPDNPDVFYYWRVENGTILSYIGTYSAEIQWGNIGSGAVKSMAFNSYNCSSDTVRLEVNIGATGVEDDNENSNLKIYPNPFEDITIIEFPNTEQEAFTLTITNLSGKVVKTVDNITGSRIELHKGDLVKGIYIIEIVGPNIYRGRIVIN